MRAIITTLPSGVDFAPESEISEIAQNVRTIISTAVGTVPLDRDFGVAANIIDQPVTVVRAKYTADIINAIKKYEPRASVISVTYAVTQDGQLSPRVEVEINDQ